MVSATARWLLRQSDLHPAQAVGERHHDGHMELEIALARLLVLVHHLPNETNPMNKLLHDKAIRTDYTGWSDTPHDIEL